MQEQGLGITAAMVVEEAKWLVPSLCLKLRKALVTIVKRYVMAHKFVHQCITHQSQQLAAEVEKYTIWFIKEIREYLCDPCQDKDFILNMDQTAVCFSMTPQTTINLRGERTINICMTPNPSKRVTAALTITTSGKKLPEAAVFLGKSQGRIVIKKFWSIGQGTASVASTHANQKLGWTSGWWSCG